MVAHVCELAPGEFVHTFGDVHLYGNHVEQAKRQLARKPYAPPTVELNPDVRDLFAFRFEDLRLLDYQAHPPIAADVAVGD